MQLSEPALTRLPQSIQEVEALVSLLYQPGVAPHDLVAIQSRLHELQLSDLGWKIGDGLLASADSNVRFFGALTFTIKLHSLGFVSNPTALVSDKISGTPTGLLFSNFILFDRVTIFARVANFVCDAIFEAIVLVMLECR
jgi:hypothetical protein